MAIRIETPTIISAAGNKPKRIEEYVGRINTSQKEVSLARMKSPRGWEEPGQTPEFDEYSLVLSGVLRVATHLEILEIGANQAVFAPRGEWVQYSTPYPEGAEYISICLPAFSLDTVHRDK